MSAIHLQRRVYMIKVASTRLTHQQSMLNRRSGEGSSSVRELREEVKSSGEESSYLILYCKGKVKSVPSGGSP